MDYVEECVKGEQLVQDRQEEYNSKKNLYNIYSNRKRYMGTLLKQMEQIVRQLEIDIERYNKLHSQVKDLGLQYRFSMIISKLKEIKSKYETILDKHK